MFFISWHKYTKFVTDKCISYYQGIIAVYTQFIRWYNNTHSLPNTYPTNDKYRTASEIKVACFKNEINFCVS